MGTLPNTAHAPQVLTLLVSQRATSTVENSLPNIDTGFLRKNSQYLFQYAF